MTLETWMSVATAVSAGVIAVNAWKNRRERTEVNITHRVNTLERDLRNREALRKERAARIDVKLHEMERKIEADHERLGNYRDTVNTLRVELAALNAKVNGLLRIVDRRAESREEGEE